MNENRVRKNLYAGLIYEKIGEAVSKSVTRTREQGTWELENVGTWGHGDLGTWRLGDLETRGLGDSGT